MRTVICFSLLMLPLLCSKFDTTKFFEDKVGHKLSYQTASGYENIDWFYPKDSAAMFYSLFQSIGRNFSDKNVPLIVWLSGGPGYNSQYSAYDGTGI